MHVLHARGLVVGLVAAPVLLTASEALRLHVARSYVENDSDPVADVSSELDSVSSQLAPFHLAAGLDAGFAVAWLISLLAMCLALASQRPLLSLVGGLLGALSAVATGMHFAFYWVALDEFATAPNRAQVVNALASTDGSPLFAFALVAFLVSGFLAVLVLGFGLWRIGTLPLWATGALVLWLVSGILGSEAVAASLANLLLLVPFTFVARTMLRQATRHGPSSGPSTAAQDAPARQAMDPAG
jgi:hypothetical protein